MIDQGISVLLMWQDAPGKAATVESPAISSALKYKIVTTPDIEKETVSIASVNYNPIWGDKQANLEKIKGHIVEAADQGADIVVIPELGALDIKRGR